MEPLLLNGSFAKVCLGVDWSFRSVLFMPMVRYHLN